MTSESMLKFTTVGCPFFKVHSMTCCLHLLVSIGHLCKAMVLYLRSVSDILRFLFSKRVMGIFPRHYQKRKYVVNICIVLGVVRINA